MKSLIALIAGTILLISPQMRAGAQDSHAPAIKVLTDLAYKAGAGLSDYERQRCKLDLYLPADRKGFSTLVWFHGGALEGGDKNSSAGIARSLLRSGVALASVEYRLSPTVKYPGYIEDGAAAFAWTHSHIAEYGGNPNRVFIGGHSAGAYLALMVGLDPRYLRAAGLDLAQVAGIIPISGQTMTHQTVRKERGIGPYTIIADDAAPVHFGRKDTPPILMLYADHDMPARAEEDAYFVAVMKAAGNLHVTGKLIPGRDHGSIAGRIVNKDDPARLAILNFIQSESNAR
jgi:acetyl esterase/lipase